MIGFVHCYSEIGLEGSPRGGADATNTFDVRATTIRWMSDWKWTR